jgi:hypothetical protein
MILIRDRGLAGEAVLLGEPLLGKGRPGERLPSKRLLGERLLGKRRRVAGLIRVRISIPGPQVAAYPGRAGEGIRCRDPVGSRPRITGDP